MRNQLSYIARIKERINSEKNKPLPLFFWIHKRTPNKEEKEAILANKENENLTCAKCYFYNDDLPKWRDIYCELTDHNIRSRPADDSTAIGREHNRLMDIEYEGDKNEYCPFD